LRFGTPEVLTVDHPTVKKAAALLGMRRPQRQPSGKGWPLPLPRQPSRFSGSWTATSWPGLPFPTLEARYREEAAELPRARPVDFTGRRLRA